MVVTTTLDLSVGNMVICFKLMVYLLCADLSGTCLTSLSLLLAMSMDSIVRLYGSVPVYDDIPLVILKADSHIACRSPAMPCR